MLSERGNYTQPMCVYLHANKHTHNRDWTTFYGRAPRKNAIVRNLQLKDYHTHSRRDVRRSSSVRGSSIIFGVAVRDDITHHVRFGGWGDGAHLCRCLLKLSGTSDTQYNDQLIVPPRSVWGMTFRHREWKGRKPIINVLVFNVAYRYVHIHTIYDPIGFKLRSDHICRKNYFCKILDRHTSKLTKIQGIKNIDRRSRTRANALHTKRSYNAHIQSSQMPTINVAFTRAIGRPYKYGHIF